MNDPAPPLAFTKQPTSGTAKMSEQYTFDWALNDMPDTVILQNWLPSESDWTDGCSLVGEVFFSVSYSDLLNDGNVSKYRILATKGSDTIISDEFTVTWTVDTEGIMYGDVNGDGKINVMDANMARRYSARLIKLNPIQFTAADVTGSGKVNVMDANYIRRYAARLIDTFPVTQH